MFKRPELHYQMNDLEPFLSEDQLRLHYEKHHGKYIENLNKFILENPALKEKSLENIILESKGPLFNNAAQAWNHSFFWLNLSPKNAGGSPSIQFLQRCQRSFGTLDALLTAFNDAGEKLFGSGWVWLCADRNDDFQLITTSNADVPWKSKPSLRPLMLADVWEHAYYVDYQHQRRRYLDEMRTYFNWNFINANLENRLLKRLHRDMWLETALDPQVSRAV